MKYEILKNGFIDSYINEVANNIRRKNKDYYDTIYKYNQLGYKIRKAFIGESNIIELYIYSTFNQIHNSFQSYVLLLERGAYDDAHIIFRSMYDKFIDLVFVISDNENYKYIFQNFIKKNLAMLNDIKQNKFFDLIDEKTIKNKISELKKEILLNDDKTEVKKISTQEKAKKSNLLKEYVYYRYLSEYTHNGLRTIYENLISTKDGVILDSGFKFDNFTEQIILAVGCYRDAISTICDYLKRNSLIEELKKIDDQFSRIVLTEKNSN